MKTFAEHSLYEQDLDEAYNLILPVALKIGKEIVKLAGPPLSMKGFIKGTVIYNIAKKYDLNAIIELQRYGIGLIMDVGKWIGVEISAKTATLIFSKAVAVGTVTLGTILISVLAVKNKSKAKEIYAKALKMSSGKKLKLKSLDKFLTKFPLRFGYKYKFLFTFILEIVLHVILSITFDIKDLSSLDKRSLSLVLQSICSGFFDKIFITVFIYIV